MSFHGLSLVNLLKSIYNTGIEKQTTCESSKIYLNYTAPNPAERKQDDLAQNKQKNY